MHGQEEEEDGFVVPDGYLSNDEAVYPEPADAADDEETPRENLEESSGEEKSVRSIAEVNALQQFISITERVKQCGKPIVITDEAILQVQTLATNRTWTCLCVDKANSSVFVVAIVSRPFPFAH